LGLAAAESLQLRQGQPLVNLKLILMIDPFALSISNLYGVWALA